MTAAKAADVAAAKAAAMAQRQRAGGRGHERRCRKQRDDIPAHRSLSF